MVITCTTQRIAEAAFALEAARLDTFPFVYLLTYAEAHEFLDDLLRSGPEIFALQSYMPGGPCSIRMEPLRPLDFNPPGIPHPRSGRVIWCTYRGITLAIKGDKDE